MRKVFVHKVIHSLLYSKNNDKTYGCTPMHRCFIEQCVYLYMAVAGVGEERLIGIGLLAAAGDKSVACFVVLASGRLNDWALGRQSLRRAAFSHQKRCERQTFWHFSATEPFRVVVSDC